MSAKPHPQSAYSGFTLIEISIVLVVIGLIVGGILAGQELVYAARIRQMGTELQKISTAINTFRLKYECLPGDCVNATTFFGTNSSSCPDGGGATGTCDGNGDGFVNGWGSGGNVEHLYAWQQLSLAKLIPWSFSNSAILGGAYNRPITVGVNVPASSFNPNIGYNFFSVRTGYSSASLKTIEIGAIATTNPDVLAGAGLTAPEAKNLDMKFDDGLPESGKIFAVSGGSILAPYSLITRVSPVNSNTLCVSSHAYLTSTASGCTIEYKPDVP